MRSISFEEATAVGGGMIGAPTGPNGIPLLSAGGNPSSDPYSTWGPPPDYDRSNDVDSLVVTATRLPNVENPANCLGTVGWGTAIGGALGAIAATAVSGMTFGASLGILAIGVGTLGGGAVGAGTGPCQPPRG
jgi:hypothetical protein